MSKNKEYEIGINTILHTKDGSKIGNAIVIDKFDKFVVKTDYGNTVRLTIEEINNLFNIAFINNIKDIDGYTCSEMQKQVSFNHKHRV